MKALVTGGSGFLGGALIRDLLAEGWEVRSSSRTQPKLTHPQLEFFLGDLSDLDLLKRACRDVDCVFHTAAIAGVWGQRETFMNTNFKGSENVLKACLSESVPRLVYTSSPSVIFNGHSHRDAKESDCHYPDTWLCDYPESKALGEKLILNANTTENGKGLKALSLRPHLIFGPGDPHLVPRILEKAKSGRLKVVGDGSNWVDMVHVDNASYAHILAEKALRETPEKVGGEAFFISNGEPIEMWPWIQNLLQAANIPPIRGHISASKAEFAGRILEWVYSTFALKGEPPMTRFVAKQLSTDHSYDISKARDLLGYHPKISMSEATQQLHDLVAQH